MAIVRFNPLNELLGFQDRINSIFDDAVRRRSDLDLTMSSWLPATDIFEVKDAVIIKAEIPGVKKEDLKIEVADNILTIKGEKSSEKEVKEESYHRVERSYGSFTRSFSIPRGLKTDEINAEIKDGVLELKISKAPEQKAKEIKIKD